jgi:hypothetical protein
MTAALALTILSHAVLFMWCLPWIGPFLGR